MDNKYWYAVDVFVSDHQGKSYSHLEEFNSGDLWQDRHNAFNEFQRVLLGLQKENKFYLPYASPKDFTLGKNSSYSVVILLMEYDLEFDQESSYFIEGESPDMMIEGREIEEILFSNLLLTYYT